MHTPMTKSQIRLGSSGYGRRLMIKRLWVQIPAPATRWLIYIINKNVSIAWKRQLINEKEAKVGQFKKSKIQLPKAAMSNLQVFSTASTMRTAWARTDTASGTRPWSRACAAARLDTNRPRATWSNALTSVSMDPGIYANS